MRVLPSIVVLIAVAAVGCKSEISSGAGPADELTGDGGASFRDEVEDRRKGTKPGRPLDPPALPARPPRGPPGTPRAAGPATSLRVDGCVSPSASADSDGDGVPDN